MRLPATLLAASLALNIALLAGWLGRASNQPNPQAVAPASPAERTVHGPPSLSSLAPAALHAALKKTDLPREVVDALVLARIFARYEARRRECLAETLALPWWRTALTVTTGTRETLFTPAQRKELRELESSARDEALRLLGPRALDPDGLIALRHAFVAPVKAVLLDAILRDYQNLHAALKDETGGLRTAADREREKFLEAEQQRDLAALLTPEERERFELRTSPAAQRLEGRLAGFGPSEAEYRAIYAVQKRFEDEYAPPISLDGRAARYEFSGLPEYQQSMREALGEARFADWRLAGQSHFIALVRLAPQLSLAPETVKHIGGLLRDTATRSSEITNNMALPVADKRSALANLATSARAEVAAKLGAAGAERYLRESVPWLNLIASGHGVELGDTGGFSSRPVDRPTRLPPRK